MKPHDPQANKPLSQLTEAEVVEKYTDYVERLATNLLRKLKLRVEREDIIAYGMEGLIDAWRRFDPDNKTAFTSFAYYRIRGAMFDGCRKEGWASRDRRTKIADYAAVNEHLESTHATDAEAPPARTLSESISRVSDKVGDVLTIMMVSQADMEEILGEVEPPQDTKLEKKARNERLEEAIKTLDENEQILVKRHHYYDEPLTVIAQDLGLSLSWCSRMHSRAIEKLRDELSSAGDSSGDRPPPS